jgi:capsular exopolysaccharide synthesis family protein
MNLRDIVAMVRRHLVMAIVLMLLISGTGIGLTLFLWVEHPTYRAKAYIQVEPGAGASASAGTADVYTTIPPTFVEQFLNNVIGRIRQPNTLGMALNAQSAEEFDLLNYRRNERTLAVREDIIQRQKEIAESAPYFLETSEPDQMVARLDEMLSVKNPYRSTRIEISLAGHDRQLITHLVNAVADSYMRIYRRDRDSDQDRRMETLSSQKAVLETRLNTKLGERQTLDTTSDAVQIGAGGLTDLQQELNLLTRDLTEAKAEREQRKLEAEAARQSAEEKQEATPEMLLAIERDALLSNYMASLSQLDAEKKRLLLRFKEDYKGVQDIQARIDTTQALADSRREELKNTLLAQRNEQTNILYQLAEKRFQDLDAQVQSKKKSVLESNAKMRTLKQLDDDIEQIRKELLAAQDAENRLKHTIATAANNVYIAQAATVPAAADKDGPALQFFLPGSVLLGILVSLLMVLMVELIDNRIRTPQQVQRLVQIPVLGNIPDAREDQQAAAVPQLSRVALASPQSLMAESFRELRTALLYSTDTELKTLMVTSGRAGVGKTVIAANLAITLAQGGSRVLLIDANFRRPMVHRVFDLPNNVGLSGVLARLNRLDEAVHTSSVAGLDVLTCGTVPPSPADLLGSEGMQNLLADVRGRYDAVIVDGPPILVVSDAHVLCGMVDGAVLVVSAASTPRGVAIRATRTLRGLRARVVGAVLNRVRATKGGYFREQYKSYYAYAGTGATSAGSSQADGAKDQTTKDQPA